MTERKKDSYKLPETLGGQILNTEVEVVAYMRRLGYFAVLTEEDLTALARGWVRRPEYRLDSDDPETARQKALNLRSQGGDVCG